ncbi:MAG: type 2 isopentenyl-diphosphate Delta-isomerase [Candidatus Bathyarchaeia archaeon]|jgi:isopentenyl-diphosphate delta-isomerase
MVKETEKRKADHIRICLEQKAQAKKATSGFEDIQLIHRALPELDREKISLSTSFFSKKLSAPLIVGAMTGGTREATKINASIAQAVEELHLGMGVGSQRAAIENEKLEGTYAVARKKAPTAFLIANIGGVQLAHGYGLKEAKKAVEMIEADALAIHMNPLQEAIQPEGQTNFKGVLTKIAEIAAELGVPVIVKETGCGISAEDAKALESAGVKAIDVAGVGGTSFAAVEFYRSANERIAKEEFWDWGLPTAVSLIETTQTVKIPVVASGGVRNGLDAAKSLALNASLASLSQPVLKVAVKGAAETKELLSGLINELRNVMFLVGAQNLESLAKVPVAVTGKTAEWLNIRGFDTANYSLRRTATFEY